jgi:short chain dehydrogenase
MSLRKLENRVAIITGAAGGSAVERIIRECGGDAHFIRTDVSDTEQVRAMASAVIERRGRIDILWNNATAFRGCSEHDGSVHAVLTRRHCRADSLLRFGEGFAVPPEAYGLDVAAVTGRPCPTPGTGVI